MYSAIVILCLNIAVSLGHQESNNHHQYMVCKPMNGVHGPSVHNHQANRTNLRGPIGRPGRIGPIGPPGHVNWTEVDIRIADAVRRYIGGLPITTRAEQPSLTTTGLECGGVIYNGRCIWLPVLEDGGVTKGDAAHTCVGFGGMLLDIENEEMYDVIASYVRTAYNFGSFDYVYIWLASTIEAGQLRWSDGRLAKYENWYPGEPNLSKGWNKIGAYIRINPSHPEQGMWNLSPSDICVPLCIST